jgi:hypothetical protein
MKKNVILFSLAGLFLSQPVLAESKYGAAGCGLGSIFFEPNSGTFMQILAATTNGSSINQSFGITSGTSNCDSGGGGEAKTETFVATNRVAISKDIARGQGETLMSVAELAGCQDSTAVASTLQKNFSSIFPNASVSDQEVGESVVRVLKSNASLSCNNLG